MAEKCSERVDGGRMGTVPCSRGGKVFDQGKWWCTQHSPAKLIERRRQTRERWSVEERLRQELFTKETYDRAAGDYCRVRGLALEELAAPPWQDSARTEVRRRERQQLRG